MCGIIGMAGSGVIEIDLDFMEALMKVSTIRGVDGTGIFQGRFEEGKEGSYLIEKKPVEVNRFFRENTNKYILADQFDNVFIGHVRAATRGALNEENCHPFVYDDIVGVHNGTLHDYKYFSSHTVDSSLLYADIAKRGHKKVLEELSPNSAYALSWFNMSTHQLFFARNDKRPLAVVSNKERPVMYWASELGMLKWMTERAGFKTHDVGYFETNKVYSIGLDEISTDEVVFGIEKVIHREPKLPIARYKAKGKKGRRLSEAEWRAIFDSPITPVSNSTAGVPWVDDKALAIVPSKPLIRNNKGKVPHVTCFACLNPMSLVEQYYATCIPVDGQKFYECKSCENLAKSIVNANQSRISIN